MGVKKETSLQERIQKYIRSKGGYVNKNWGNMTSAPGIADLSCCYKGCYLAIEVKEGNNLPSKAQGIHCREVQKAGGLSLVAWSIEEVKMVLCFIDRWYDALKDEGNIIEGVKAQMILACLDDGTGW